MQGIDIFAAGESVIGKTVDRFPIVWANGEGGRLWSTEGKPYLDFFTGHGVMSLGYAHPRQTAAMTEQLRRLPHIGNQYYPAAQVKLASQLVETSFGDRVFFSNSGAEIVDLSIKLARRWARQRENPAAVPEILTMNNSFHGRTYGALSATNQEKFRHDVGPMLPGIRSIPFNDSSALRSAIGSETAAILLEPIQGEGGIISADRDYLIALRALCDQHNLLLIFDEIQCGLGKTGCLHAYEYYGVVPDVLLLGKALGGGLPLSALVTTERIAAALGIPDHGSTFGGNPVAAAGGSVLLEELGAPGFLEHLRKTGALLNAELNQLRERHPGIVREVRGTAFLQGLALKGGARRAVRLALDEGLITSVAEETVLRLLPPFIIGPTEIREASAILDRVLDRMERSADAEI